MDDWCSKHEMPLECAACNGDMENLRDKAKEIDSLRSQLEAEREKIAEHNVILNRACGEVLWPKCKAKDSEMCETCPRHYLIGQTQGDDNEQE